MRFFFRFLKIFGEVTIFLFALFLMVYLTYYFGWALLPQGQSFGNDIPSALNNLYYLKTWYPPMPKWIHLWAGGLPFLQFYPILPFITTFLIHNLFGFSLLKVVKLIMFFSIPLTAAGVVFLGRILTKNWLVGILAGILFIISPDSWLWITVGGFYAMAFSVPFFTWALVFFCLWQTGNFYFGLITAILYGLTWLSHPMAGTILAIAFVILGFGYGFKSFNWRGGVKNFFKSLGIIFLGVALFAWWIMPFLKREEVGGIGLGAEQMYRVGIKELLGLEPSHEGVYIVSTFFAASFWILFLIGAISVFLRRSILRWAFLACIVALFIMTAPSYAQPLVRVFQLFWSSTNVRTVLVLRILGPIIASYGAFSLVRPIFWIAEKSLKGLKEKKSWVYATEIVGGIGGFLIFWVLLKNIVVIPDFGEYSKGVYSGYGPLRNWIVVKEINGEMMVVYPQGELPPEPLFKKPEVILREIPRIFSITGDAWTLNDLRTKLIVEGTKIKDKERIDINPMEGGIIGSLGNFTQASQIQAYFGTSLIQKMIGWEIYCVYYSDLCDSDQISDLYSWFGVSQAWLGGDDLPPLSVKIKERLDRVESLKPERVYLGKLGGADSYWNIYHFQESTGLANITNKPTILVIGDNPPQSDVFDIVFRGFSKANFGYNHAWSVKGRRFVDDYSLDELSKFEGIILHGYQYHHRDRAWELLKKYVSQGGRIFVNTGWQYMNKDWGMIVQGKPVEISLPEILPVEKAIWGEIRGGWKIKLGEHSITQGVGYDDWGQPIWSGQPWGVAFAKKEWLRNGAVSLLENDGQILMAVWQVGRGKVAWTGFDVWGHLTQYRASDERKIVHNLLAWLFEGDCQEKELDFERVRPELIKIDFETLGGRNKLMFKEVASDNWQAFLRAGDRKLKLPIYKAGPGWKMVFLPEDVNKGTIVFDYHKTKIEQIGFFVSVFSGLAIFFFIVLRVFKKNFLEAVSRWINSILVKKAIEFKKGWQDEEG